LLVGADGRVGEASSSNIFVVVDDEIVTAPIRGILPGTARARLLAAAQNEGLPIVVRELTVADISRADEIVLTNAARLAVSAASIDGRPLQNECGDLFESWIRQQP
jgi:branched-chain amino acid aminotransferase